MLEVDHKINGGSTGANQRITEQKIFIYRNKLQAIFLLNRGINTKKYKGPFL